MYKLFKVTQSFIDNHGDEILEALRTEYTDTEGEVIQTVEGGHFYEAPNGDMYFRTIYNKKMRGFKSYYDLMTNDEVKPKDMLDINSNKFAKMMEKHALMSLAVKGFNNLYERAGFPVGN